LQLVVGSLLWVEQYRTSNVEFPMMKVPTANQKLPTQ